MPPNRELARTLLKNPLYPRTAKYDPDWQVDLALGCPTLWLLERLCECMDLKPGMRVLDLGCGYAGGSIFLAKEFGLQVWAADILIDPSENWQRINKAGLDQQIFPIHVDARDMPFAEGFFDAVISVNAIWFFATDDRYLRRQLVNVVRPGGQFGIVTPGFYHEFEGDLPENLPTELKPYWDSCWLAAWHSADWWRRHWLKTNQVDVLLADNFPGNEGYQTYLEWERMIGYDEQLAEQDGGKNITFVRLVARRKEGCEA